MLILKHTLDEKIWTVWKAFTKENGNFPAHLHFAILKNLDNEENIGGYTQNKETLNNTIDPLTVQFINN